MGAAKALRHASVRRGARQPDPNSFANNQRRYEHFMSLARNAASSGDLMALFGSDVVFPSNSWRRRGIGGA